MNAETTTTAAATPANPTANPEATNGTPATGGGAEPAKKTGKKKVQEEKPISVPDESPAWVRPPGWIHHDNLWEAVRAVMSEVSFIQKEKVQSLNYKVASQEAFVHALRPAMMKHGLVLLPAKMDISHHEQYPSRSGGTTNLIRIVAGWKLIHTKTGESYEFNTLGEAADSSDKASNKAMTAANKYAVRLAFLIETGEDPDKFDSGDTARGRTSPASPSNGPPAGQRNGPPASQPAGPPANQTPPAGQTTPPANRGPAGPPASQPAGPQSAEAKQLAATFAKYKDAVAGATTKKQLLQYRGFYMDKGFTDRGKGLLDSMLITKWDEAAGDEQLPADLAKKIEGGNDAAGY